MNSNKMYPTEPSRSDGVLQGSSYSRAGETTIVEVQSSPVTTRKIICVAVLFVINLLNYMDRYTIAGVLANVQKFYGINDSEGGLISTVFIIVFMIFSPICGYLGDRYNRKMIMSSGLCIWALAVLACTFAPPNMFWLFMVFRGIVGIGEASYATLAPTVIADMFTGTLRSTILMIFYFAIPVGSGLGFIVGSKVAAIFDDQWQWGVRVTCVLGIICLILLFFFVDEPERGAAEKANGGIAVNVVAGSYKDDMKALVTNPTYLLSTFGYTAIVFVVGTMSWWIPTAVIRKEEWAQNATVDAGRKASINMNFGIITTIGGIVGVAFGTLLANAIKSGFCLLSSLKTVRADPIVCGFGALIGVPSFYFAVHYMKTDMTLTWVFMLICITALCFNWAINVNILMEIVPPARRNSATAWQILCSHLFGDASGPLIVGVISDALTGTSTSLEVKYNSLVTAFYLPNTILIISVILYSTAAYTIKRDLKKFAEEMGVTSSKSIGMNATSPEENSRRGAGAENKAYLTSSNDLTE